MKSAILSLMIGALMISACSESTTPAQQATSAPAVASQASEQSSRLIDRINSKGTIVVVTEGSYAPFTFTDEKGHLTGYDVEVTRAVAKKLGVNVEFKTLKWVGILPGLENGDYDIAANQITLSSPERQAKFDKAEPYSWSGVGILVREDDNRIKTDKDIAGLTAAQMRTSSYGERASKAGASIRSVESLTQAGNLVKMKEADLTMNDDLAILDYVKNRGEGKVKLAWSSPAEEKKGAGLVLVKGNDEALAKINEAMLELKQDGTLKQLGEQFFGRDVSVK